MKHKIKQPYVVLDRGLIGQKFYELPEGIKQIELYHGTTSLFLDNILSNGIKPRKFTGKSNYGGGLSSNPENVYLAAFLKAAYGSRNAVAKYGGNTLMIKLSLDTSILLPDEDSGVLEKGAKRFRPPTCWKESLEYLGTCAHQGIVKPDNFLEVVEYASGNLDKILKVHYEIIS